MARCPGCNKFPALDASAEPEVSIDDCAIEATTDEDKNEVPTMGTATVTGTVRIVLTSECCGQEMKESNYDIDLQIDIEKAADCTCENWLGDVDASENGPEITDESESTKPFTYKRGPLKGQTVNKPIPYRYQKRYYGVSVPITVMCGCGKQVGEGTFVDRTQASGMDELN